MNCFPMFFFVCLGCAFNCIWRGPFYYASLAVNAIIHPFPFCCVYNDLPKGELQAQALDVLADYQNWKWRHHKFWSNDVNSTTYFILFYYIHKLDHVKRCEMVCVVGYHKLNTNPPQAGLRLSMVEFDLETLKISSLMTMRVKHFDI